MGAEARPVSRPRIMAMEYGDGGRIHFGLWTDCARSTPQSILQQFPYAGRLHLHPNLPLSATIGPMMRSGVTRLARVFFRASAIARHDSPRAPT